MVTAILPEPHRSRALENKNLDCSLTIDRDGVPYRFRVNVFHARGQLCACFRYIPNDVPSFEWPVDTYTDADLAYWDAATTVMSLVAQFLQARKILECWALWIVVDVLAVGIYAYKGLYITTILYTVFLGLATWGYLEWRRSLAASAGRP